MPKRSTYLAVSAAAGAAVAASRRVRLRRAARGIQEAILPTRDFESLPSDRGTADDEVRAPGHRHRDAAERDEQPPEPLRSRPWTKHGHGMTHPYSGQ